jgi:hypothetical protein
LLIWPVKNSRTRFAAFGVGVKNDDEELLDSRMGHHGCQSLAKLAVDASRRSFAKSAPIRRLIFNRPMSLNRLTYCGSSERFAI